MARKYTILRGLTPSLNKDGFTLIELIVGLAILSIIVALALNAFNNSSQGFNQDKKNIESAQNLTAVLEVIGNDIKQAGEKINDALFPVIQIEQTLSGSSRITLRRALTTPLTLCESIGSTSNPTTLIVADNALTQLNCKVGTLVTTVTPAVSRPQVIKEARDYRCKLDNINGNYTDRTVDYCNGAATESVLAALSDRTGNTRFFKYDNDGEVTPNLKYNISISSLAASPAAFPIGSPIYLIDENVYSLDNGNLQVQRNGGTPEILLRGIAQFKVSARVYGDKTTQQPDAIDPSASIANTVNVLPISRRCTASVPYYICDFNNGAVDDWKTLQGVKIDLQSRYDATGRSATPTAADLDKSQASAEFFPRNVLSK